ncbi:MAG: hypothetical protein KDD11_05440 [Acidobacteria bacterium]|nr:hypothetical protein [Acidobacteriota bacterium]
MFDLILSSYRERRPERDAEYRRCLEENLANPWISRIFVFYEDPGEELPARFEHPKIEVFPHGGKALSFRRMFDLAAERSAGRRVIVANADIYFDHTLGLLESYDLSGRVLALARHNVHVQYHDLGYVWDPLDKTIAQDCWIFEAPLPEELFADINIGWLGSDNWIAWEMAKVGLVVENPARTLRAWHLHKDSGRDYSWRTHKDDPRFRCLELPVHELGEPLPALALRRGEG